MPGDFSVIEGRYLGDILDQPRALDRTLAALEAPRNLLQLAKRLQKQRFKAVILTGMGSSLHALHLLNLDLIEEGHISTMVETSELIHHEVRLCDARNLIIAVSQSGESAEVVRLLRRNGGHSPIIAVTNTPKSRLAKAAEACIVTQARNEFSVSCKTYVTSLMALRWLSDVLCGRDLRRTVRELKSTGTSVRYYLANWKERVQQLSERIRDIRQLFLVGRGSSLAAVSTGALIIKEADHFPAEGMSSAAFRHGPYEMIGRETFVGVFSGEPKTRKLNRGLLLDIRKNQGQVEWIGDDSDFSPFAVPKVSPSIAPVVEILPAQMLTLALAARAGREPGHFSHCTKVTETE